MQAAEPHHEPGHPTRVGVVAIGRNEGERLRRCLESLSGRSPAIVYVDSGSTDGSVELARSLGAEVVELDRSAPFSAARARNAGFERLRTLAPELPYVQFVDGDCEVDAGWLPRAAGELDRRPELAVVCGRRRERFPERSIYNRLADLEWDTPVGEAESCGGDALMRTVAFEAVGGFDPAVTAGEEPELCRRLRQSGWRVARIDAEMTRHDLNVTRFAAWWRRQVRSGYGSLAVDTLAGGASPFHRQVRSVRIWTIGWLAVTLLTLGPFAWMGGPFVALGAAIALAPLLQALRVAWKARRRLDSGWTALAHGVLTMLGKWGELLGQWNFLRDRRLGRGVRSIEYKQAGAAPPAPAGGARLEAQPGRMP